MYRFGIVMSIIFKKVEEMACYLNKNIRRVSIPHSCEKNGSRAFYYYSNLVRCVRIKGTGLKTITPRAFENYALRSISLPSSLKIIGFRALSVGNLAFAKNMKLSKVKFAKDSDFRIGCSAFSETNIEYVEIPSSWTKISSGAFANIKNVVFEPLLRIRVIGSEAFMDNRAKILTIHPSIVQIDNKAFASKYRLSKAIFVEGSQIKHFSADSFCGIYRIEIISNEENVKEIISKLL